VAHSRSETIPPFRTSEPKLAAAGLALGGTLDKIEDDGGRLTWSISGLPPNLLTDIANDKVTVSVKSYIAAMETVLSLIAERRRGRSWR